MSLWQGQFVTQDEFWEKFNQNKLNKKFWTQSPLDLNLFFTTLEKMSQLLNLKNQFYQKLCHDLVNNHLASPDQVDTLMDQLNDFISVSHLRIKLQRELGTEWPFELKRVSTVESHFECWFPLGTLIHITPNNSPLLNVLAMIEGLLSGNINVLKLGRKDSFFAEYFFEKLCELDLSQELCKYIFITGVNTHNKAEVHNFLSIADVISAWGGEESLTAIKAQAPEGVRLIEWGHRISLSYISKSKIKDLNVLEKLAYEICLNDQQACSSPQVVYIETENLSELKAWAQRFADALSVQSQRIKPLTPSDAEIAEITIQSELTRMSEVFDNSDLIQSPNLDWRLYLDFNPVLRASPLYRTLWVKPIQRQQIVEVFSTFKKYLQTVGLCCEKSEIFELVPSFFRSGFLRIKPIGQMTDSYMGEPHDGLFALQRFCKKVSLTNDTELKGYLCLS